ASIQHDDLEVLHFITAVLLPQQLGNSLRRIQDRQVLLDFFGHPASQCKSTFKRDCFVATDSLYLAQFRNGGSRQAAQGIKICSATWIADTHLVPVRNRIAISSECFKASAPFSTRRSRGRSLAGSSRMSNPWLTTGA